MTGLKLYLFGAPRLESAGASLPVGRRKGLAILAYLALKGQPQTREALATLFWPDFDQSRALSNLRRELSRLKTGPDVELIDADRRQVELVADSVLWVDVRQFNQLLAQVASHGGHFPAEACDDCLGALTAAVSLYTDRFLAGFNLPDAPEFDDWQFFEAEGLSQALAEALQKLIHWYAGAAEFEEAIRYGRRWLALDPLHEMAHRELMAIYARAGQQAAALRQYEECARILTDELGIEPEAETTALYEAIRLRKFPAERPAGPSPLQVRQPSPAQTGAGRYASEEKLAVGGQGEVFLGRDKATGEQVILKWLRPDLVADAERVARFLREAEALRQLQHPNIVRMLDAFEHEGRHCIVMEYVSGGTLRQLLEKEAPLPAERVLALGLELADALGRAHHLGIIHRDLKPGNVLLTANGSPRLTDFGTARLERDNVRLTRTGALVGSPSYMSPEALRGDPLDPRSDIWSFGILLYEMLTGRRPFEGETLTQVLLRIMTEQTPSLAELQPHAPPALVALVEKMLAKEPDARPRSIRQIAAALEAIQAGRWPQGLAPPAAAPVADAAPVPARLAPVPASRSLEQEIRFCRALDGVQIAYATVGEGPPLVKAANWLSHLEYDWQSPIWNHWLVGLARSRKLIRYDERGCGLSDWDVDDMSFAAWVSDLETVVDTLGIERFPLLGISQGAAISIAYAARHPQRVSHLILYGGYAVGRNIRDDTPEAQEETQVLLDLVRLGWGKEHAAFRQVFTSLFLPDGTAEQVHAFNELQRMSSSPENAARLTEGFGVIDVSELATKLDVPTLVLHARGDLRIPFAEGRRLASLIPGARFVPLESDNHILLEHEPAWSQFLTAVRAFLGDDAPPPRQWSGAPAAPARPAPEPPAMEPSRFVAREQEMAWLQRFLDDALDGNSRVAFITGEAGQGKTSLAEAFMRRAAAAHPQLITLSGNCNAYTGQGDPYLPFREILQRLAGDVVIERADETAAGRRLQDLLPDVVQALTAHGPDLLDVFVPARALLQRAQSHTSGPAPWINALQSLVDTVAEPDGARLQQSALFAQIVAVLSAIARRHPLLLFIDDLQWVDRGSADLLLHLGKRLGGSRILLVGAYRAAEVMAGRGEERHPLQQVVHELQRDLGDIVYDLGEAEGRAFVDALLDSAPNRLDDSFRATLFHQTQGHPLFTIELLRAMQERGDLFQDEAGYWQVRPPLDWGTLPARVEGAIGERIARLQPALQELLQTASVIGEEFSVELLAQLTGEQPATLARLLGQELDREHRLVQAAGIRREGSQRLSVYRFRHILIQLYLYRRLDEIERAYRHQAVAEALEQLAGPDTPQIAGTVARHFAAAELPERAAPYWRHAGDQAWRGAAMVEAADYYQAALAAWPGDDAAGLAALNERLGSCRWYSGQLRSAVSSMETAYGLFTSLDDRIRAGAVQRMIGRLYWEQGERQPALEHYHRALDLLEKEPEGVELAWAYSSISQMHMLAWEYDESVRWGERALSLSRRLDAPVVLSHALNNVGSSLVALGKVEEGLAMLREARNLALVHRLTHDAARAHYNLAWSLGALDRYDETWTEFDGMLRIGQQHHLPLFAGSALVELAVLEWMVGRWRDALARHDEVAAWLQQAESLGYLELLRNLHLSRVANDLGKPEEALGYLQAAAPQVERHYEAQMAVPFLQEMIRALVFLGRVDQAGSYVSTLLELIDRGVCTNARCVVPLLESVSWLGAQARWAEAEKALAQIAAIGRLIPCQSAVAALAEGRGLIAAYGDLPGQAIPRFEEAATIWQRLGRPCDHARALVALAEAQVANGQRDAARATLTNLEAQLADLEAQLDDDSLRHSFRQSSLAQSAQRLARLLQRLTLVLPAQATPFIGREAELNELRQLLAPGRPRRLLTLVGPGGIGKTRLAIEVAARSAAPFRDGLAFVPLASLSAVEQLAPAIGKQLGLEFRQAGNEQEELLRYLETRELLLVLDNFEHLLDGVTLVDAMLSRAPRLTILATSRETLGLSSETVYRLEGLSYPSSWPAPAADLDAFSAVTMLRQLVARHLPAFDPAPAERQQIARICHLVQGMPLALVLAANWVELLSLEEIADEIASNFDLLEGELRDLPARQRSVRAVFHTSWEMLDEAARAAAARLAIFRGPFSREAAEAVAGAPLRTLLALVNKSWLQRAEAGFQMHELVRQYALEQLQALSGAEEAARDAHAAYFAALLEEYESRLHGAHQRETLASLDRVFEQASAAWRWLVLNPGRRYGEQNGLQVALEKMLPPLYYYCEARMRVVEFFPLLRAAIDAPATGRERAICLAAKSAFFRTGFPLRIEASGSLAPYDEEATEEAWQLASKYQLPPVWQVVLCYGYGRSTGRPEAVDRLRALTAGPDATWNDWELAFGLEHLAILLLHQLGAGRGSDEATAVLARALEIFERLEDRRESGYALRWLGQARRLHGELLPAIRYWEDSLALLAEAGDWIVSGYVHWQIGDANLQLGNRDAAFSHYRKMSEAAASRGHLTQVAEMCSKESFELARYGQFERALEARNMALQAARMSGLVVLEAWCCWEMGELYRLWGNLDEAVLWYERALPLFTGHDDITGRTFYYRGLADVALAQNEPATAGDYYRQSLASAESNDHGWAQAYALVGLGRTAVALGELEAAQETVVRALAQAEATTDRAIALAALAAAAELLASSGAQDLAAEVAASVVTHPISWLETRRHAECVLAKGSPPAAGGSGAGPAVEPVDVWEIALRVRNALQ